MEARSSGTELLFIHVLGVDGETGLPGTRPGMTKRWASGSTFKDRIAGVN
jgi:hypothetical protein